MTLIDYPSKVAAIIFTIGCNFRCHFCYNTRLVDPALFKKSDVIDEKEILEFLKNRIGKLDAVVITGGEPTLQPDLKQFITKVKKMGFLVKLDTNGTSPDIVKDLLAAKLIDYIAMDVKNDLTEKDYKKIVNSNINIEDIKKNITVMMQSGIDYEFRTTVAPDMTKQDIKNIVNHIKGAKKYYLQEFQAGDVLDNKCKKDKWLTRDELDLLIDEIKINFGECKAR